MSVFIATHSINVFKHFIKKGSWPGADRETKCKTQNLPWDLIRCYKIGKAP